MGHDQAESSALSTGTVPQALGFLLRFFVAN